MAWHVFPYDREWCTRGYHLRVCRISAELRTVSGNSFSMPDPGVNAPQSHTATWPQKIQISASQENMVTPQEFHHWVNQNNGVLCKVTAQRRPEISPNNESLLGHLISSLADKSMVSPFLTTVKCSAEPI